MEPYKIYCQHMEEPITKQYLHVRHNTYISNTSAESIVDAVNLDFETKT